VLDLRLVMWNCERMRMNGESSVVRPIPCQVGIIPGTAHVGRYLFRLKLDPDDAKRCLDSKARSGRETAPTISRQI